MKISAMIRLSPGAEPHTRLLNRMADYARRIEASGFPGIWVGDSLGRGRPTLDPLTALAALAAVTEPADLGICALRRDRSCRTRHRGAAVFFAPPDRARAPRAIGAGPVRRKAAPRGRQRLDAGGFQIARR